MPSQNNPLRLRGIPWIPRSLEQSGTSSYESFDACDPLTFRIVNRIGSASMTGRVYEIQTMLGGTFAMKIMYRGVEECVLAKHLSDADPRHFPIVFGHSECPEVLFDEHDAFRAEVEKQFINDALVDTNCILRLQNKRLRIELLTNPGASATERMLIARSHGIDFESVQSICATRGFPMTVLVSELCWGDLATFVQEADDVQAMTVLPGLVADVWAALWRLRSLGYAHGDLHLGNVLVRYSKRAIIHDFGTTCPAVSESEYRSDASTLMSTLLLSRHGRTLEELIMTTINRINDSTEWGIELRALEVLWRTT